MTPRYPVYIISKGRYQSRLTAKALQRIGVPFSIVVEPQEADQYRSVIEGGDVLVLPFSNLGRGSIPARNWVWTHAIATGARRHWILDDNIYRFRRLYHHTMYPCGDASPFCVVEDIVDRYENVPMAGMNYEYLVKHYQRVPPVYLNTRVYSMILLSNDPTDHISWRGRFNEDTDLSLRFLKRGDCTILTNAFVGDKVTTQVMKGGNTDDLYANTDDRLEFAQSLVDQHPDVVQVTRKFGRWHHQVDYRPFKKNRLIKSDRDSSIQARREYRLKLTPRSGRENVD